MSKLIIDMPMPDNCGECPLLYMEIVKCTVTGRDSTEYGAERPSWCPIKGVLPEEHGRLGDLDELAAGCDDPYWCRWLSEIEDAPTIVPATERSKR